MTLNIFWSDKLKGHDRKKVQDFFQKMANRLMQGHARYGSPVSSQNYMTRLIMEVKHYKRNGNMEQLINIANYAWLESQAPENPKFHFDSTVDSVTRGKL